MSPSWYRHMLAACKCAPKMCTGNPSAEARSWLSPVMMQHEKSRALEITTERAARSSVLVISRTMPSSRFAMTDITIGSSFTDPPDFFFACAIYPLQARQNELGIQQVVARWAHFHPHVGIHDDRRRGLFDDGRPDDRCPGRQIATPKDRR